MAARIGHSAAQSTASCLANGLNCANAERQSEGDFYDRLSIGDHLVKKPGAQRVNCRIVGLTGQSLPILEDLYFACFDNAFLYDTLRSRSTSPKQLDVNCDVV